MIQAYVQRRRLVLWFSSALVLTLPFLCALRPFAQMSAEAQRYRVELGSRMRPAGLGQFRSSVQTTMQKLAGAPELQHAIALSALEEPGSVPFHLRGAFAWTSDTGHRGTGSIEEDFYTERWSRLTLVLDGVRSRRWVLNGQQYLDDQTRAVPFEPRDGSSARRDR